MGVVSLDLSLLMVFTSVANCKYLVRFIITGKLVNAQAAFALINYIPGIVTFLIVSFASDTIGKDSTKVFDVTRGIFEHEGIAAQPPVPRADVHRSASLIVIITAPFRACEAA